MKYACKFYQGCPMLDSADEIIIKYTKKDREIIDFVQKWKPEQRIILNITELEDIEKNLELFNAISKIHNVAFLCSKTQNYSLLSEECLSYFFIEKCDKLDEFFGQLRLKVSDVYITNELAFNIVNISSFCKDKGVKIRITPNIVQSGSTIESDDFTKFFIRPDDIYLYEDYVDVIEFEGALSAQNTLYQVYQEQKWNGDLSQIILGLRDHVPNDSIPPVFGRTRLNCGKRCCIGKCDICNVTKEIAKELNERNIYFERNN